MAGKDFFISYARDNRVWADWIAAELERAGYSTVYQAADIRPGHDFVHEMQKASESARRTIAVLSPAYLASAFTSAEWHAAFTQDPTGDKGLLIPVRVQPCAPPRLLAARVYVDLVEADEAVARDRLLAAVDPVRPRLAPAGFPGRPAASPFPGAPPGPAEPARRDRPAAGWRALSRLWPLAVLVPILAVVAYLARESVPSGWLAGAAIGSVLALAVFARLTSGRYGLPSEVPYPAARLTVLEQIPRDVSRFTGREDYLATLDRLVEHPAGAPATTVIAGMAGVGKTALAVHWAHRMRARFPDGVLYLDLHVHGSAPPVEPADALDRLLRDLGEKAGDIPATVEERAVWYRSRLAGRRFLVVLDDAVSEEQVRPLLPGSGSCAVVVTSRARLAGLVARDGATRLDLDLLSQEEAVTLLERVIGAERASTEPAAVDRLATACARLPLALSIAGARVTARPRGGLAELVEELAQEGRLAALELAGDPADQIRTVFSWSCSTLRPDVARMWRLLGLHAGPHIGVPAAAALGDVPPAETRRLLDTLAGVALLKEVSPGRYEMHDLLDAYAAERVATEESAEQRAAAVARMLSWYLHAADAAAATVAPHARRRALGTPAHPVPVFATPVAALDWCEAERENLLAAARQASAHGHDAVACDLVPVLWWALHERRGYYGDLLESGGLALAAARRLADRDREAAALDCLGRASLYLGHRADATVHLEQALALYRETGDPHRQARTLNTLGLARTDRSAVGLHRQALALYRETGDRHGEGGTLLYLGYAYRDQYRRDEALKHFQLALDAFREAGDPHSVAHALVNIGFARLGTAQTEAVAALEQAADLYRESGDWASEANVLTYLGQIHRDAGKPQVMNDRLQQALARSAMTAGHVGGVEIARRGVGYWRLGEYEAAVTHLQRALPLLRDAGNTRDEANTLLVLGVSHRELHRFDEAAADLERALALYEDAGDLEGQAEALHSLGRVCFDRGASWRRRRRIGPAIDYYQRALVRYRRIGDPYREGLTWIHLAAAWRSRGDSLAEYCLRRAIPFYADVHDPVLAAGFRRAFRSIRRWRWAAVGALLVLLAAASTASAAPPSAGGAAGFVRAELPTAARYRPAAYYLYNSAASGDVEVRRDGAGSYRVRFGGLGTAGGIAHATAYGDTSNFCAVAGWAPEDDAEVVRVRCYGPTGEPADTRFVANFAAGPAGTGRMSYLLADRPTDERHQPDRHHRYDSTGRTGWVERRATGRYEVFVPASAGLPGGSQFYQVSAVGAAAHCKLSALPSPSGVQGVDCRDPSGKPVDARFALSFSWLTSFVGRADRPYEHLHLGTDRESLETGLFRDIWWQRSDDAYQVVAYAAGSSDAHCHIVGWSSVYTIPVSRVGCWSAATDRPTASAYVTGAIW
ncbi:TIR domain-containing protein [Phytohabitans sp. LJ34]|uniref:TIR domain-containing protein n=1 Tax=Phytohabitans sp. LJ34 TaxID=3452217 RepID=UPI003F8AA3EC